MEEHDETIIENYNKLVKPEDRVYMMGDISISRRAIATVGKLNGRKKLIKGNHDIFKLKDYTPYFEDVSAYRIYPDHSLIVSHIPIHSDGLEHRFKANVHGHKHGGCLPDPRYLNLCLEYTDFKPVEFEEIICAFEKRGIDLRVRQNNKVYS